MENKRFERSRSNRVIAGVCAGLADYFNIDMALMRVLFVVSAMCGGFGFWMYVILWIVIPEENILGPGSNERNYDDTIDITQRGDNTQKTVTKGAFVAGFILIFIGLIALVDNFLSIAWLWKLWPVGLIIIGAAILINTQKNKENEQ